MTSQDLILIAEACGWELKNVWFSDTDIKKMWDKKGEHMHFTLEFLNSLDSMQQAVLMQDEEFQETFAIKMINLANKKVAAIQFHRLLFTDWQQSFIETLQTSRSAHDRGEHSTD